MYQTAVKGFTKIQRWESTWPFHKQEASHYLSVKHTRNKWQSVLRDGFGESVRSQIKELLYYANQSEFIFLKELKNY